MPITLTSSSRQIPDALPRQTGGDGRPDTGTGQAPAYRVIPVGVGVRSKPALIALLIASILLAGVSFGHLDVSISIGDVDLKTPSVLALIWLVVYLACSFLAFRTIYLLSTAYVVCLFVFHYGLVVQYAYGWVIAKSWDDLLPWVEMAVWISNLALGCLGTGLCAYLLAARPPPRLPAQMSNAKISQNLSRLRILSVGLLIASGILIAIAFARLGNILSFSRFDLFYHAVDTRWVGVFTMIAPAAALGFFFSARTAREKTISYLSMPLLLLLFLATGIRSLALFPLMAGVVLWVKFGRRINPAIAAFVLFAVIFVIPVVGHLRTMGAYEDIVSASAIAEAAEEANVGRAFASMGGSLNVVVHTLKEIPANEHYRYGHSYLNYVFDSIPNIGFNMDRTSSRANAGLNFGDQTAALFNLAPADWAAFQIVPSQFRSGGGTGFSAIAEPYFNFGVPGVVIFFLLVGVFLGKLDNIDVLVFFRWLVFSCLLYWNFLTTVRNEFGMFVKPTIFTLLVVFGWLLVRRMAGARW